MKTMNFKNRFRAIFSLMILMALIVSCSKDDDVVAGSTINEDENSVYKETLSNQEIDGMLYLVENEKLLCDFFTVMYEKHNLPLFNQLALNEQKHLTMLSVKIDRYDLENPADQKPEGQYVNPELQGYYDQLVEHGNSGVYTALIGAIQKIEKDVVDIPVIISGFEGNDDVVQVISGILFESQDNLATLRAELRSSIELVAKPDDSSFIE